MKCHSGRFVLAGAALFWTVAFMPLEESSAGRPIAQAISQRLANGTEVTIVAVDGRSDGHRYQYLPTHLTLSQNRKIPEFSFLPYRKDDNSPVEGAIMHFLVRWGLTAAEEQELQQIIQAKVDSLGVLEGASSVQAVKGKSWEITAKHPIGVALNRGITSSGQVPTNPGHKMAIAFRFDGQDAKLVDEMLRSKRGAWGEEIRLLFKVGTGVRTPSDDGAADWVLEADLGALLPRAEEQNE